MKTGDVVRLKCGSPFALVGDEYVYVAVVKRVVGDEVDLFGLEANNAVSILEVLCSEDMTGVCAAACRGGRTGLHTAPDRATDAEVIAAAYPPADKIRVLQSKDGGKE